MAKGAWSIALLGVLLWILVREHLCLRGTLVISWYDTIWRNGSSSAGHVDGFERLAVFAGSDVSGVCAGRALRLYDRWQQLAIDLSSSG